MANSQRTQRARPLNQRPRLGDERFSNITVVKDSENSCYDREGLYDCCICLNKFNQDELAEPKCGHAMCKYCFITWRDTCFGRQSDTTCPICRDVIDDFLLYSKIEYQVLLKKYDEIHALEIQIAKHLYKLTFEGELMPVDEYRSEAEHTKFLIVRRDMIRFEIRRIKDVIFAPVY